MGSEEKRHNVIIQDFLKYLNERTDNFILKGGTALRLCYKLPRFSEDIDLDAEKENILSYVQDYCKKNHFEVRIAKNTPTVKRCMINYGNESKPLKIEVSYRNSNIDKTNCIEINNINVYDVNRLAKMKAMAYAGRDKIRDMYDLAFICNNFWDNLSKETKENIRDALMYKGIDQFEYIIATQSDDKIDETELLSNFLQMCDSAGVLSDDSTPEKDPYELFCESHSGNHIQNEALRQDWQKCLPKIAKSAMKFTDEKVREEVFLEKMKRWLREKYSYDEVAEAFHEAGYGKDDTPQPSKLR